MGKALKPYLVSIEGQDGLVLKFAVWAKNSLGAFMILKLTGSLFLPSVLSVDAEELSRVDLVDRLYEEFEGLDYDRVIYFANGMNGILRCK